MPHDFTTSVLQNIDLGNGTFFLEFYAPEIDETMEPAQFFMIGIPGAETLLRRPYSVCGLPGTFSDADPLAYRVLYKVFGRGTGLLSSLKPGAKITVLGPLGRGFELPQDPDARPIFVAGGIGSAPFPALVGRLNEAGRWATMFYGGRSSGDLALLDWFRERCDDVVCTTEDGSAGLKGRVTGPLAELLAGSDTHPVHLYACGPQPMLLAVARIALDAGVVCDLALEAHMACGFGVCLGCVVPTRGAGGEELGYERVCMEGPVMRANRLAW